MRIAAFSILALVAAALGAQMPQKAVIVSYPDNTPDSIIDQAKALVSVLSDFFIGALQQKRQPKFSKVYKHGVTIIMQLSKKIKWFRSPRVGIRFWQRKNRVYRRWSCI
jgi:hypothetical protein